jgi:hypothetical protein
MGVLSVKLIGEVGVVVDMSLAAFVVCVCACVTERKRGLWFLVNGGQRREALGSECHSLGGRCSHAPIMGVGDSF